LKNVVDEEGVPYVSYSVKRKEMVQK